MTLARFPWMIVLCVAILFPCAANAQVKQDVIEKIKAALPKTAPAVPKKPRKVLIYSKTNGYRHGSIATGAKSLAMLGEATGAYTSVHSEDETMFEPEKLKQFDAVIMLNTTGECLRAKKGGSKEKEEALKKSLVNFVKSGKGLVGTHSATDTYKRWKEYNDMMGGAFAGHPWHTEVPIKNLYPDHPLNKVFGGKGFTVRDEIYQFRDGTARASDRRILLSLDPEWKDIKRGNRKDGTFPISWIAKYGEGRTFYCSLGHRNEIYYNPVVLQHYLAGIQYALGDLKADATPSQSDK
jgi:type 1 glutamine amidotransferase